MTLIQNIKHKKNPVSSRKHAGAYSKTVANGMKMTAPENDLMDMQPNQSQSSVPSIQPKLSVDKELPADKKEPLAELNQKDFQKKVFSDANVMVNGLCPQFGVDQSTGIVKPLGSNPCNDMKKVADGERKYGCCCLCVMTDPKRNDWKIRFSDFTGPQTDRRVPEIVVPPIKSFFKYGSWTKPDDKGKEKIAILDPVVIFGHELCGHAAVEEMGAQEKQVDRVRTDEHDHAVRIQNEIAKEQGVADDELRAEAAEGSHRGETTIHFTLEDFPFNATSISDLPKGQREALNKAAAFARDKNTWIDILGHSDTVGSEAAKKAVSIARARAVKRFLIENAGLHFFIQKHGLFTKRYTHVEGRSDKDADKVDGAIFGAPDPKLRRVQVIMSTRPAAALNPDPSTPTEVQKVGPEKPDKVKEIKKSGNPCEKLIVDKAWPKV